MTKDQCEVSQLVRLNFGVFISDAARPIDSSEHFKIVAIEDDITWMSVKLRAVSDGVTFYVSPYEISGIR